MSPILISVAVFVAVAALIGGLALMFRGGNESKVEDRLSMLTAVGQAKSDVPGASVIAAPLDAVPSFGELVFARFEKFGLLFEQADTNLTPSRFFVISGAIGLWRGDLPVPAAASLWSRPLAVFAATALVSPLLAAVQARQRAA